MFNNSCYTQHAVVCSVHLQCCVWAFSRHFFLKKGIKKLKDSLLFIAHRVVFDLTYGGSRDPGNAAWPALRDLFDDKACAFERYFEQQSANRKHCESESSKRP